MRFRDHSCQRGQVFVLFVLLVPVLFLLADLGLDAGWHYMNVSRLQNAADAAALAGAQTIIDRNESLSAYQGRVRLVNAYAGNPSGAIDTTAGDDTAADYVLKNLSPGAEWQKETGKYVLYDSWGKKDRPQEVTILPSFYKADSGNMYYYVVQLKEAIPHFLMLDWFDLENAEVTAIALLEAVRPTTVEELVQRTEQLEQSHVVIGNWEVQNLYHQSKYREEFKKRFGYDIYDGNWNQYQDPENHYARGEHRRTETVRIAPSRSGSSFTSTSANDRIFYTEDKVDSLNIDFRPEITFKRNATYLTQNWDLKDGYEQAERIWFQDKWDTGGEASKEDIRSMRIHTDINFNAPYAARASKADSESADMLWVRLESEAMLHCPDSPNGEPSHLSGGYRSANSVHQVILNFNEENTAMEDGKYVYRPVVLFYDGPEAYEENKEKRESKPVIVNLNADFNGILYLPNSPVVLNGNGKNFNGYIVAKSYVALKAEADVFMDSDTGKYYSDAGKSEECFKVTETNNGIETTMFIDKTGNVLYKDLGSPPTQYGNFNAFGRTDLDLVNPKGNLFLSGK